MDIMPIAAQLYTVRDPLAADFAGTLRRIRAIGYEHVELAGLEGRPAAEVWRMLADAGLSPGSSHFPLERLESELSGVIADAHALGVHYIVCPYIPEERRRNEADWRAVAAILNRAGQACRDAGLQLCYHHHSFEFVRLGAQTALELLLAEADAALVKIELDTYWIRHGGDDPAAWIRQLGPRCPLLHLKDMADDLPRSFAPVGTGVLDWPAIFAAARHVCVEWFIVEQDICSGDPFAALEQSFQHIQTWQAR